MNNIFAWILAAKDQDHQTAGEQAERCLYFALFGLLLGILAPFGWLLLRLVLFYDRTSSLYAQTVNYLLHGPEQLTLVIYMGVGTALVLSVFGFFIARASEQIRLREKRLNDTSQLVASQKEDFEQKYRDLNNRINNFHLISAGIQRSMDLQELMTLTANGLHEVMGFDRVNILNVDHEKQEMRMTVSLGSGERTTVTSGLPVDERAGVFYKAITEKRHYLVDDITLMPADFRMQSPFDKMPSLRSRSFMVSPVVVNGVTEMVVGLDNKISGRPLTEDDVDTLKLFASQLAGSIIRLRLFTAVDVLTRELEQTFIHFLQHRQDYQSLLKTLLRASHSSMRLVADVANSADVVRDAVGSTQSASTEISASIDQVNSSIKQLSEFMDKSISAMSQIAASIKEVDDNSINSHQMSEQVRLQAEGGVSSLGETLTGLDEIATGVAEAADCIDQLSLKGNEISSITSVITEIAQKTNLLALNAAIIAAQAGEQGRSFAVVAEEIRGLSQKTAHSSEAIARLIKDMHNSTADVVKQIHRTREKVIQGTVLGRRTDLSLKQILVSATAALDMAHSIRNATREVSSSAEFVTHSIEELGEMTEQVSAASREQALETHAIAKAIEDIRNMADDMASSAIQQRQDSRDIEAAVKSVAEMAEKIFSEMDERSEQSRSVIRQLKQFQETGQ